MALALTSSAICDAIDGYTGETYNLYDDATDVLNAGYRKFLMGRDPRPGPHTGTPDMVHAWSFLRPWTQITVGGVQTTDNASQDDTGYIASSQSVAFDESMVGRTMTVVSYDLDGNSLEVEITGFVDSSTVNITPSTDWTAGSCDLSVNGTGIADLPDDFGGLLADFTYRYNRTYVTPDILEVSPEFIYDQWRGAGNLDEYPTYWAMIQVQYARSAAYHLMTAPINSVARTLYYRHLIVPPALTDSLDFPMGGAFHTETIKAFALAEAETDMGRTSGVWAAERDRLMIASIELDKQRMRSRGPVSMGRQPLGIG